MNATTPAHEVVDLGASRINWKALTNEQIEAVRREAAEHGDAVLAAKAARAQARR